MTGLESTHPLSIFVWRIEYDNKEHDDDDDDDGDENDHEHDEDDGLGVGLGQGEVVEEEEEVVTTWKAATLRLLWSNSHFYILSS